MKLGKMCALSLKCVKWSCSKLELWYYTTFILTALCLNMWIHDNRTFSKRIKIQFDRLKPSRASRYRIRYWYSMCRNLQIVILDYKNLSLCRRWSISKSKNDGFCWSDPSWQVGWLFHCCCIRQNSDYNERWSKSPSVSWPNCSTISHKRLARYKVYRYVLSMKLIALFSYGM